VKGGPPPDTTTLLADLREAEKQRAWERAQATEEARWQERLGPGFQGIATDWNALRRALTWTQRLRGLFAERGTGLPAQVIRVAGGEAAPPSSRELRAAREQLEHALHSLEIRFEAPGPSWEGKRLGELTPEGQQAWLQTLRERVGALADWSDWRTLHRRFEHLGLAAFWEALQKAEVPAEHLPDVFLKSALGSWVETICQQEPALASFRRADHERVVDEFRELDRALIRQSAAKVAQQAEGRRPAGDDGTSDAECALLRREAHKKTRHLPIRRLFEEMPGLLLRLKPCLLMSPLSVSQFLPADRITFDVVVFDEASQICPEDAVGAVYRGRQTIITGDDRQLPPTSFFQQNALDDDLEEEDEGPADFESILDACLGAGLPAHLLRWHYRSRNEGLIAYSNRHFYDGRLVTFPAAGAGPGVGLRHVADGIYDRGGRRDNAREAAVVADLVFEHVRSHGDKKTLGVIAFSQAQMTAIADEIERRLRQQPDLEPLFKQDRLEGFFVKNLETVQGDERDVILLSVGYGRDAGGRLTMHFGPLNREGGERRLNVAVTRAREKLVVVSSLRAADIDPGASKAAGLAHLKSYLDYAERGAEALQTGPTTAGVDALPGLERDLMDEVRRLGYEAAPQVGCSDFRLDVGVTAADVGGRFLLGIECDGPGYQAAATVRDRDRLRPEVLAQLGWRLHRVWAPAWVSRREEEVERLRQVLAEVQREPAREPPREVPSPQKPKEPRESAKGSRKMPSA
jgi:hypothetical protein